MTYSAHEGPLFSVIVPVFQQWDLVPALLERLKAQKIEPGMFELILVDNAREKSIESQAFASAATILHCQPPGSYAARNLGAAAARGEWLCFTDADCLPDAEWLGVLQRAIAGAAKDTLIAGGIVMQARSGSPNSYEMYDIVKGIPQQSYVSRGYGATANLTVSAELFRRMGGFDASRLSGGDADFCRRAGAGGAELRFLAAAKVFHPARDSWEALVTKARRVKGGQLRAGRSRRRAMWALRTLTPPVRALYRFGTSSEHPLQYRLAAMSLQLRIWGVEIGEMTRLLAGKAPERR